MKIVHVVGYYPPHLGGMELRTKEISENIANRGHEVTVLTSDIDCKTGVVRPSKNLTVCYLKSFEWAHTPIMPALPLKLLFMPKDWVVHLHISQAFGPEVTFLICKLRKIPYVAHIHLDVDISGPWGFLLPLYKKLISTPIVRNADAVTVLTKDYKKLMMEKYHVKEDKLVIIPNGTNFKAVKNPKTKIYRPVRLLFVGRLSVQKNLPLLLKAVAICIKKYQIPLTLKMAGDGEKRKEVGQMIKKLKIGNYVTLLGQVELSKLPELYQSSDICILPSISEGLSSVLLESMTSGTPIIATDIASTRNVIKDGHNGLLVKNDARVLAAAVKKLIDHPKLYQEIVINGLKEAKKYDYETVTDKYEALYRKLCRMTDK